MACHAGLLLCLRMEASISLLCGPPTLPWIQLSPPCGTLSSGREKTLQDARLSYQQFTNVRDNLSSWLEQLPHNQVQPSDGPSQIAYKLEAQKVRAGARSLT